MPDGLTLTGKCFEKNAIIPESSYIKITSFQDKDAFVGYLRGISLAFLKLGITSVRTLVPEQLLLTILNI